MSVGKYVSFVDEMFAKMVNILEDERAKVADNPEYHPKFKDHSDFINTAMFMLLDLMAQYIHSEDRAFYEAKLKELGIDWARAQGSAWSGRKKL